MKTTPSSPSARKPKRGTKAKTTTAVLSDDEVVERTQLAAEIATVDETDLVVVPDIEGHDAVDDAGSESDSPDDVADNSADESVVVTDGSADVEESDVHESEGEEGSVAESAVVAEAEGHDSADEAGAHEDDAPDDGEGPESDSADHVADNSADESVAVTGGSADVEESGADESDVESDVEPDVDGHEAPSELDAEDSADPEVSAPEGSDDSGEADNKIEAAAAARAAEAQKQARAEQAALAARERAEQAELDRKAAIRKAEERAAAAVEKKARRDEKKASRRDAKAAAASTKRDAKAAAAVVKEQAQAALDASKAKPQPILKPAPTSVVSPLTLVDTDNKTAPDHDESAPEELERKTTMDAASEPLADIEEEQAPTEPTAVAASSPDTSAPSESRKERKAREAMQEAAAEREAAEAKQAALVAKAQVEASEKAAAAERASSRGARFGRLFRSTLWRLLGLAIVAGLIVGAYFAWPRIKEEYIDPVETTSAEVSTVRADVAALQNSSAQDTSRLADLIAELDDRLIGAEADNLALQAEIDSLTGGQVERDAELAALDSRIEAQDARLGDIDELTATLGQSVDQASSSMSANLALGQASDLLSRSRLFLYQANYGLAKSDINAARAILSQVEDSTGTETALADVIARLDIALLNLPDRPVAASADLDIAWQALLSGETDGVAPPSSFIAPALAEPSAPDPVDDTADQDPAPADEAEESDTEADGG